MTRRVQASLGGGVTYDHTFDVENRLKTVTVSNSNLTTNFAYDASGQRVVTDVKPTSAPVPGDTRTITTYPFPGYEVEQRSTWQSTIKGYAWIVNATITRKTYFLGGQAIATHISGDPSSGNNGFFYLHSDHLGSTSLLTYGNGQTNPGTKVNGSETRYYPYGAQRLAPTLPADNITDRDFTGQKENSYIKLIYMNARWYDSQIGRFVSADSIVPQASNPQAYNRYSYGYNNPVKYSDPTGHYVEDTLDGDCTEHYEVCANPESREYLLMQGHVAMLAQMVENGQIDDLEAMESILTYAYSLVDDPSPEYRLWKSLHYATSAFWRPDIPSFFQVPNYSYEKVTDARLGVSGFDWEYVGDEKNTNQLQHFIGEAYITVYATYFAGIPGDGPGGARVIGWTAVRWKDKPWDTSAEAVADRQLGDVAVDLVVNSVDEPVLYLELLHQTVEDLRE